MTSRTIELEARDGGALHAYLASPDTPNGGAIVVLQEIFGVNANIRAIADDFARDGFFAIAPDLFWRQKPDVQLDPSSEVDRERATTLLKNLDHKLALQDAMSAAELARGLGKGGNRVGAVGYCLGGKLAYMMSLQSGIAAAVSYYGVAIQADLDKVGQIQCPLLLHIAEEDHLCPPDAQRKIAEAMEALGSNVTIISHPGVGHAFARRNGQTFNAEAAERADMATMKLLSAELVER
jgi:carboxymethylenebutenolidase